MHWMYVHTEFAFSIYYADEVKYTLFYLMLVVVNIRKINNSVSSELVSDKMLLNSTQKLGKQIQQNKKRKKNMKKAN